MPRLARLTEYATRDWTMAHYAPARETRRGSASTLRDSVRARYVRRELLRDQCPPQTSQAAALLSRAACPSWQWRGSSRPVGEPFRHTCLGHGASARVYRSRAECTPLD